jgi:hypothetical protein
MDGGSGWGMVADPEPEWIRSQSVQWILTRKMIFSSPYSHYHTAFRLTVSFATIRLSLQTNYRVPAKILF